MNIYLISFWIVDENRARSMVGFIKEYGKWARISPSSWCIKADDLKTADIRNNLNQKLPLLDNERLIVFNVTNSAWASYNLPENVADWLKDK